MLLNYLRKTLSSGPYYVRLRPQLISIRDVASKESIEDKPIVAMVGEARQRSILAIGASAASVAAASGKEYTLVNGFEHPRSIIADFEIAEKTLQHYIRKLAGNAIFRPAPIVIIHVLDKTEGGLTQVEIRALCELALGAGAREAYVWTGQELTDQAFASNHFPGNHWHPQRPKWVKTQ